MRRTVMLAAFLVGSVLGTSPVIGRAQSGGATLQSGIEALKASDFGRAERIFLELLKKDATASNYAYLAMAESSTGHLDQALDHFRRSLRLGNDSAVLHYYFGLAYLKNHENSAGIRELQLATLRDAKFGPARSALGVALLNAGRPREAIPHLEQARALFPEDAEVWASLVRAKFEAGEPKEAIQSADTAMEAIPDDARLPATLAFLCLHHRQPQKARQLLENASELRPEDNTLKLLLAQASIKAGEPLEALAVLKGVPAEAGVPGELAFLRGSAYLLSGEPEEAHPLLSSAIDADPKNADYLFALAGLQGSEQSYEAALRTLEKARQLDHRSEAIPYQIAVTFALMGRYADATKACEEALSLSTQRAEVYFLRGVIKLEQRDGLEAERALREAISLSADVALYHAALGVALLLVENLEESKKELDRARILNPKTAPAYLWRARVLGRLKHPEMAIADLETYLALQPQSAYALHELEVLCAAAGQAEKASAARAKYQALNADHDASERAPSFLDELWMTRIREGLGLLG